MGHNAHARCCLLSPSSLLYLPGPHAVARAAQSRTIVARTEGHNAPYDTSIHQNSAAAARGAYPLSTRVQLYAHVHRTYNNFTCPCVHVLPLSRKNPSLHTVGRWDGSGCTASRFSWSCRGGRVAPLARRAFFSSRVLYRRRPSGAPLIDSL